MDEVNPRSRASIFGHPIHPMLIPFPIACFVGALVTDLAYWSSATLLWLHFSSWLIAAGLVTGALAGIAGLIDFLSSGRIRSLTAAWVHMLINVAVLVIEFFNALVHARDGWTAVVPTGLILSTIAVLLLLVSGWLGGAMVYKHRVGVRP